MSGSPSGIDPELELRLSKLSPAKRALFLRASGFSPATAQQVLTSQVGAGFPRRAFGAPVPLSYAQELLWRLERTSPGHTYNVPRSTRLRGALEIPALQRALDALVARHEILRTTFDLVNDEPRQIINEPSPVPLEIIDLTETPAASRDDKARDLVRERSRRPFDLARDLQLRATVVRLDADDHVLLLESHHVSSDIVSRGIIARELQALYRELLGGTPAALTALGCQYGDFAAWQRRDLAGEHLERRLAYWRTQLAGLPPLELPTDRRATTHSRDGAIVSRDFAPNLVEALRQLSARREMTLFMTLLAGIDVLLARHTGQEDFAVGAPISGRPHADLDGVVGFFVNTLVLRTSLDGNPSFWDVLDRVRQTCLAAFEHQDVPYELLIGELARAGRDGHTPLFNTLVSMLEGDAGSFALHGTSSMPFSAARGAAQFDLVFSFRETKHGLGVFLEYRRDLFDAETARRMLEHLENLLAAGVREPRVAIGDLPVLSSDEQTLILDTWNATAGDYPATMTLDRLVAAQAARTPNAPALHDEQRTLTYAELDSAATALARRIRPLIGASGARIGICAPRSSEIVIAIFAVLKAGGTYVPLDPDYPTERFELMLADSSVRVLLTTTELAATTAAFRDLSIPTLSLDDAASARDDGGEPMAFASPDDVAYVMYTSGSTGRPKGVLVTHRNVIVSTWARWAHYPEAASRYLLIWSFSFDGSTELYWPLCQGGMLVIPSEGTRADANALARMLATHRITHVSTLPSFYDALLAEATDEELSSLRVVIVSGEVCPDAVAARHRVRAPKASFHNEYGPTETTVWCSVWSQTPSDPPRPVTIGRPIANARFYILDARLRPVPVGVHGELFVGGLCVTAGYLNQPELTEQRFVPDPFSPTPNARMYRTGDKVRWRSDGSVEYIGRVDFQVKLRGHRIELGEIEAVLAAHPLVRHTVVIVANAWNVGQRLVAYYVPVEIDGADESSPTALRAYLRERLPEYMVPPFLVPLERMPLSANGKIDRKALPAPHAAASEAATSYAPPRTTHEHQIVKIWTRLLDTHPIGIHDNFFDIGGHSLLAVRMLHEIEQFSGRRIPLAALFDEATIQQLAARLEAAVHSEGEPPAVVMASKPGARPFVFLHGDVHGGGWYCRRLARLLGGDVKLIVLPTLYPDAERDASTVEQMAARHIAALREVQSTGPYHLGGFCFGGIVAFEMAQQLLAAGETVEHLVLVDTGLRNAPVASLCWLVDRLWPAGPNYACLVRRGVWIGRLLRFRRMKPSDRWKWLRDGVLRRFARAAGHAVPAPTPIEETSDVWTRPGGKVILFEARAASAYIPRRYDAPIDLVVGVAKERDAVDLTAVSTAETANTARGKRGWDGASRDVRVHPIQATHVSIITDQVSTLAEQISACLHSATASTSLR
jgi:amino acid adenylation domain-containing protein